jgi:NADPH-dependent ferric siderophore reductase
MNASNREIKRVMHTIKRRVLTVKKIEDLMPNFRKITFTGKDLNDFESLSPDDHIKVFVPYPGEKEPILPSFGPGGPMATLDGRPPLMRDYTPLRFDRDLLELDIAFVLHKKGPASLWASQAKVGDILNIGGPKGSTIVPFEFDWYLSIGDETAIPSIARRLQELPKNSKAVVILIVEDEKNKFPIIGNGENEIYWFSRKEVEKNNFENLKKVLEKINFPEGDFYTWISGEKAMVRNLKDYILENKKGNSLWLKAQSYWEKN